MKNLGKAWLQKEGNQNHHPFNTYLNDIARRDEILVQEKTEISLGRNEICNVHSLSVWCRGSGRNSVCELTFNTWNKRNDNRYILYLRHKNFNYSFGYQYTVPTGTGCIRINIKIVPCRDLIVRKNDE